MNPRAEQELREALTKLQGDFNTLSQQVNKNNFTGSIVFSKDAIFQTRLKVPHYDSAPAICEVGDLIEVGGKLFMCTVANTTFTLVGSQT